ncbi:hypothetical protein LXA43DRAFT_1088404 [Ganoderma leucocontextum]|nr:hypothetical protein LXA43DRAFT_1088404 [Ganoderma leucocontextum]
MKLTLSALVASVVLLQAHASPTAAGTAEVARRSAAVGCGYNTIPLLRGYSAQHEDHFYTTSASQMDNAIRNDAYVSQGDAALVFPTADGPSIPGAIPLYRMWSPTRQDHFYTASAAQRDNAVQKHGYTDEGVAAYVYGTQLCGSVPLYRTFDPVAYDHFYTANETEKFDFIDNRGYVDEGTAAFVFPV